MLKEGDVLNVSTCVTSVKWINKSTILIGVGGYLQIVRKSSRGNWGSVERFKLFTGQNIYGFDVVESMQLVAAYGGKQYCILRLDHSPLILLQGEACDWILDVRWLGAEGLTILTAHGKLLEISSSSGSVIRQSTCPDRSILYCGRIVNSSWKDLVVLSGTAHNQILVWTDEEGEESGRLVTTLSGHKGVIFSLRYDEASSSICSTSDDRTARLWKVDLGDSELVHKRWQSATFKLELTLYGHTARVFQSTFLTTSSSLLATVGEDGGVMVWKKNGECVSQNWIQAGLLCVDNLLQDTLAAGGADGSLCLFPLHPRLPPVLLSIPENGVAKQVFLMGDDDMIAYCDGGNISFYSESNWKKIYSSQLISSYCILGLSPSRTRLATATIQGQISIFTGGDMSLMCSEKVSEGRVFSLHWLNEELLLASCLMGQLYLITHTIENVIEVRRKYVLAESKERWTTCATIISTDYLICGDRQGSLHVYCLCSCSQHTQECRSKDEAVYTARRAHVKGVSCMLETSDPRGIMTCGRDGTMKKFLLIDQGRLQLILIHKLNMDWASHILQSPCFPGHLILGFHSVYLCIWSVLENRFIMKLKCWGGHRSWDVDLNRHGILRLVFIKDKVIHVHTSPLSALALPIPLSGHHNKGVNACCVTKGWIVSCGEDCTVRVCSESGFKQVCCVSSHLSSVRAIALLSQSSFLVTGGGRAQLKLWSISHTGDLSEASSHMLRTEDELKRTIALDLPEVRYMCISVQPHLTDPSLFRLYAVASDGIIRIFEVDSSSGSLILVYCDESGRGRCLLQVSCMSYGGYTLVITAGTDGRVEFRKEENNCMEMLGHLTLHSGGINSLWCSYVDDLLLLVTGGDDAILVLSLICLFDISVVDSQKLTHLHTCQITGIHGSSHCITSVGLDSRACLLRYKVVEKKLIYDHISTHMSSIPDIHGVHIDSSRDSVTAVVFGIGMERVRFKLKETC